MSILGYSDKVIAPLQERVFGLCNEVALLDPLLVGLDVRIGGGRKGLSEVGVRCECSIWNNEC